MATSDAPEFRLLNLHVQNFRGIDSLKLDFTDGNGEPIQLAVLAGDNGCGKTSVLEAILMVLGRDALLPARVSDQEQVRFGAAQFNLAGEFQSRPGTPAMKFWVDRHSGIGGASRKRMQIQEEEPRRKIRLLKLPLRGVIEADVEYFSAHRELLSPRATPDSQSPGSESQRLAELKRRFISTYYRSLRRAKQGAPEAVTPFDRLQRLWTRFSTDEQTLDVIPVNNDPGSGDEVVLRDARRPIPADITSLFQAREQAPKRSDIPRMLPLERLSSGQVALFAFAGPLIFRDRPADFVLIDEPEQHLHVQWQRLLLPALRELSPTSQFIVATHSTEILEAALSYERFILVSDRDPRAQLAGDGESEDGATEPA